MGQCDKLSNSFEGVPWWKPVPWKHTQTELILERGPRILGPLFLSKYPRYEHIYLTYEYDAVSARGLADHTMRGFRPCIAGQYYIYLNITTYLVQV